MKENIIAIISSVEYHRHEREDGQVSITLISPLIVHIKSNINGFIRAEMAPDTKVKHKRHNPKEQK